MKTDAGWKLWTRKPSADAGDAGGEHARGILAQVEGDDREADREIAQTPAASPSTPSEKFTTFITATSPSSVSGPPNSPRSTRPRNGNVKSSTRTPESTQIRPAAACPSSLTPGERSRMSSSAADRGDERRGAEDPARLRAGGQEQRPGHQHADEDRQAAEQRRCARGQPALLPGSTAPTRTREAGHQRRDGRRQRQGDHKGKQRAFFHG